MGKDINGCVTGKDVGVLPTEAGGQNVAFDVKVGVNRPLKSNGSRQGRVIVVLDYLKRKVATRSQIIASISMRHLAKPLGFARAAHFILQNDY